MADTGQKGVDKFTIIREMINAIPARISLDLGFQGPSYTVSASSESGLCAIAKAYDLIRTGGADVVVAGGADTLLCKTYIDYYNSMKLLSTDNEIPEQAVRPFDRHRKGFVLSDGAGVVVLEAREHALQRGARVYAQMEGYSASWTPLVSSSSMADAMSRALETSRLLPEDIGYLAACGTATIDNDRMESQAIQMVFNGCSANLPISSMKSMIGHAMGASGAIQFGLTAMMIYYERILPTINYINLDPECSLNYVPNQAISSPGLKAALVNSFGFNGHQYVLGLIRFPEMMTQHT
jgi:3-oxoacyl-[acyl-carrier-protein] synthase II